jgi:hypothetical protein
MCLNNAWRHPSVLLALLLWLPAQAASLPDPEVRVQDQDGTLVLDITYRLPVSQRVAWDVLTDFEAMPGFVPNLEESHILRRDSKRIIVEQKGHVSLGLLNFPYESRREIETTPYQMLRAHSLTGTQMDSTTVLTPAGEGTLLFYHATATPSVTAPSSMIASTLSEMLESQFKAMGQEMMSRAKAGNDSAAQPARTPVLQTASAQSTLAANKIKPALKTSVPVGKPPAKKRPG